MRFCILWFLATVCLIPAAYGAEQPIVIAGLFPGSGVLAEVSSPAVEGARLAVEEINRRGGVLGRKLELELFDTRSCPLGAKLAAGQAARSRAVAMIGPNTSQGALLAAAEAEADAVPMISFIATHPDITQGKSWVFRICFTDRQQGKVMADTARREVQGPTAVLLLSMASDYSMALGKEFKEQFEEQGGKVVETIFYHEDLDNIAEITEQARRTNAAVCFIPGLQESGRLALALQEARAACVPVGGDGWGAKWFMLTGGSKLKRAYFCDHWSSGAAPEASLEFIRRYGEGRFIEAQAVLAWDAVHLLAQALEKAGTDDRGALRRALEQTRDFRGAAGIVSFETGHDAPKEVILLSIIDGRILPLAPANPHPPDAGAGTP